MEGVAGVTVKTFSETFMGQNVNFYVLRLKQSFLLWVGTEATFTTMAAAMNIKFVSECTSNICTSASVMQHLLLYISHFRILNQPVLFFWVMLLMFHPVT